MAASTDDGASFSRFVSTGVDATISTEVTSFCAFVFCIVAVLLLLFLPFLLLATSPKKELKCHHNSSIGILERLFDWLLLLVLFPSRIDHTFLSQCLDWTQ